MESSSVPTSVENEARLVNNVGTVLAVLGWAFFMVALVVAVILLVQIFDNDPTPLDQELNFVGVIQSAVGIWLLLAAIGHSMRLFAAYTLRRVDNVTEIE